MHMNMHKAIAMVASLAAVVSMAACGGSNASSESTYKTEPQEGTPTACIAKARFLTLWSLATAKLW